MLPYIVCCMQCASVTEYCIGNVTDDCGESEDANMFMVRVGGIQV